MRDLATYDYAIVRVVPKVERAEFVNVGVIVSCPERDLLLAKIEVDERHLNPAGAVHGGMLATLVDTTMGAAVKSAETVAVTAWNDAAATA